MDGIETIGKKWIHPKTGEVRYYVNDPWQYGGLYVERYNTGNICYSELDGEKISHSKAYKLIRDIDKCYVTEDGKVHIQGNLAYENFDHAVIAGIKAKISVVA